MYIAVLNIPLLSFTSLFQTRKISFVLFFTVAPHALKYCESYVALPIVVQPLQDELFHTLERILLEDAAEQIQILSVKFLKGLKS